MNDRQQEWIEGVEYGLYLDALLYDVYHTMHEAEAEIRKIRASGDKRQIEIREHIDEDIHG